MLKITLIDKEVEALRQGQTIKTSGKNGLSTFKIRVLKQSERNDWDTVKYDPTVNLVITPHDLWDMQMGGIRVDYRLQDVRLRAPYKGPGAELNEKTLVRSFPPDEEWPPEKTQLQTKKRNRK